MSRFPMSGQRLNLATPMTLSIREVILALGCLLMWQLPAVLYGTTQAMTNFVMMWIIGNIGMMGS